MFIKLTKCGIPAEALYIKPEAIVSVESHLENEAYDATLNEYVRAPATLLHGTHYDSYLVVESVEVVMALIQESTVIVPGARL